MGMSLAIRRFTVEELDRMAAVGILREDDRVELLDGQIVEMTPIGVLHAACVTRLGALLGPPTHGHSTLRSQCPLVLFDDQAPQPDVALVRYRPDGYQHAHPRPADAFLVIEVADTSVEADRAKKIPLYARAGVREAWLVNLPAECIEMYRHPEGDRYADERTARRGEIIAPLGFPDLQLLVSEILG